jgi:DNA-binding MarR family transcriptional regulator
MPAVPTESASACPYVIGDDGLARWPQAYAEAWIGLLETHKRLTRELESELEAAHGLTLSSLELLGRLAPAEDRTLGLSALAAQSGLSLSRVSRIVDALEGRGLVERRPSSDDGRAKNAWLTDAGLNLLRAAQATHFAGVQKRFFEQLEPGEIAVLAAVFARYAPGAASDCI